MALNTELFVVFKFSLFAVIRVPLFIDMKTLSCI